MVEIRIGPSGPERVRGLVQLRMREHRRSLETPTRGKLVLREENNPDRG